VRAEWGYTSGRFLAFDHDFGVRTSDPALGRYIASVLDGLAAPGSPAAWYSLEDRGPDEELRYALDFDGEQELESPTGSRVVATLLWHVNRHATASCTDRVLVHAAGAVDDDRGVVLPARMESGKTTLVAGLVRAGLRYLTDEAVAVDPTSYRLHGLAKPLTIDPGSWLVLADLEPEVDPDIRQYMRSWNVDVRSIRPDAIAASAAPALVILPRYEEGATTALTSVSRGLALMALCENSFNLAMLGQGGIDALTEVVRRSACYALVVGDLATACDLVLDALRSTALHSLERESIPFAGADVAGVDIDGESVLMNRATGSLHHLDALGTAIWACCDGSASVDDLAADVAATFDIAIEQAKADVARFVRSLIDSGLLTHEGGAKGPSRRFATE